MRILRVHDAGTPGPPPEHETENPYGEVQESEIIIGGTYKEVVFREGSGESATASKQRMLIAQVPFNKMDILAMNWGKPQLEAALYLSVDPAKVETILPNSFEMVIQEGRRLNFTLLRKWHKWQTEAMTATGRSDQIEQIIKDMMTKKADEVLSGQSSNS